MTESQGNELAPAGGAEAEDVEGHYLPLDEEGNVDVPTHRVEAEDDVEGHASLDLDDDMERKR